MAAQIYKQSAPFRTALCALAAVLFLIFAHPALAETDPAYTVEGVEVDVTAKNAVKARETALGEAQVKAYQMLAERFLSPEELKTFKAPDADSISMLVQDFEVTNEQLSTTRYKGTYTIRFRPTAFKSQMASKGQTVPSSLPKPVLVLPMIEQAGATTLWMNTNPWLNAWRNLPTDRSMMQPTVLPLGDATDVAQISDREGLQYDPMRVQQMATRYNAEDVALLLASSASTPDGKGQLVVNIYNNGFEGPRFVQKVTFDRLPNETDEALYTRAATRVKFMLRENWKANAAYQPPAHPQAQPPQAQSVYPAQQQGTANPNASPYTYYADRTQTGAPPVPVPQTKVALGPAQNYMAVAKFASAQDWVRMKNALDRIYGMQAVMVKGLKPREAALDLRYAGTVNALQLALQNAGITMRAAQSGGGIEIYMGQAAAAPASGVYR